MVGLPILIGAVLAGCKDKGSSATTTAGQGSANKRAVVKIIVKADGVILVDGVPTLFDAVDARLAKLGTDGGEVWYYRENPEREPHPNAVRVIELVMKHRLAISMSSKPDFSDYIDDEGKSHPRN